MSGYRQSSFDPNAYEKPGKPLRPYNWVQWTGVALTVLGVVGYLAFATDRIGWTHLGLRDASAVISLPIIGAALINSRHEPGKPLSRETMRKRLLIILAAVVVAGILAALAGFSVAYFSKGA